MNKYIHASLLGLAFSSNAFAAEDRILDDVVITASRINQSHASIIGDVTVIDREAIKRVGAGSIVDLLKYQAGVQINSSGGAGTDSDIYLRGTNADHIVVLVDGLRINSATKGTTALQHIPLAQIEKIEILRGPASSLYGADAIGGVIQIFTKKGASDKPLIHAALGLASYHTRTAEAGFSAFTGDTLYGINVNKLVSDGYSAIRFLPTNTRSISWDRDGYRNLGVSAFIDHTFSLGQALKLQYFGSQGNSDSDINSGTDFAAFTKSSIESYALTSTNQLTDFWRSTLKLGKGMDDYDYHASATSVSLYTTEQNQYTWQNDLSVPVGTLALAYDRLEQQVSSSVNYTVKMRNNNAYLASYVAGADQHSVQASLRLDSNSQYGKHTTGGIGYGYHLSPLWRASVSFGTAFKAPTFNQLYYPNFGDPTLLPEQSKNLEASLKYATDKQHAGVTVFNNKIRNLIAFSGPATASCTLAGYCPINVSRVEILGATFDGGLHIRDNLTLNGNLTVSSPRDSTTDMLLIRRAKSYGTVGLMHTWGDLQWGAEVTGASTRYNNATNTKKMNGYALLNLTANYRFTPEWKLEARANNVLDKEYVLSYTGNTSTANPYGTAGANVFVGLRYQMHP